MKAIGEETSNASIAGELYCTGGCKYSELFVDLKACFYWKSEKRSRTACLTFHGCLGDLGVARTSVDKGKEKGSWRGRRKFESI